MEERVSPLKHKHENDNQPPPPPPLPLLTPTPSPPSSPSRPICMKGEPTGESHGETYVVRVPKVQIYRVPPPENAIIAERFQKPENKPGRGNSIFSNKWFVLGVIIILVVGVAAAVICLAVRPNTPAFSVDHVLVKHKRHPEYYITLKTDNPNHRMSILYEKGGSASLTFKNHEIAAGKNPALHETKNDDKQFEVVLTGADTKLPSEIDESLKEEGTSGRKKKKKIELSLTVSIPVKMKLGIVKDMVLECDVEVNTLSQGTRVLHQKCNAKI